MYLFNRRLRLAPGAGPDGIEWALRMTEKVDAIAETDVALWAPRFSAGTETLSWTTVVEDLGQLEALEAKLLADTGYLALAREGAGLRAGDPLDDGLAELVHADPDAAGGAGAEYVSVVTATTASGAMVRGIEIGVEIALLAKEVGGYPTSFGRMVTGEYGGVAWFTVYPSIEALQSGEAALGADPRFTRLVDERAATAYRDGTGLGTIWRKLA